MTFVPAAAQSSGRTVVVAAVEGHVAGLFGLVDTLRPEAKHVVSELGRMGLEVKMYFINHVCVCVHRQAVR